MGRQVLSRNIQTDQAFKMLYRLHWSRVYSLCMRFCQDESAAKDMTQNIFLSVWDRGLEFPDDKSAEVFLTKAARFQVMNYFRDQKINIPTDEETGAGNRIETWRYNPETMFTLHEFKAEINSQVNALEEPTRTIFMLSRDQDKSYREISEELGIAVKTVEKHMSRALLKLRTALQPDSVV
ncbi:sigma-70 family RNA polymerase sigma factor [Pedobacter caeni]|nr:sigma-70 family RNA polymerase sigma factor [Pedobacter caeni]